MFLLSISITQVGKKKKLKARPENKHEAAAPFIQEATVESYQGYGWQYMVCFRGLFSLLKTLKSRVLPKSKLYKTINTLIISLLPQNSTKSFFLTLILDSFKIKLKEALS